MRLLLKINRSSDVQVADDWQTVREKHLALCGTPMQFMDTMQMPLRMVANTFWDEDKREEWFEQLKEIMLGEMVKEAGGEDEQVKILFDGIVGWGWKSG